MKNNIVNCKYDLLGIKKRNEIWSNKKNVIIY
jgi:hypothetical protein